ncbi:Gfo/Idh/MocA family protein [Candidatus Poribacteria bacterium]
MEKVRIGIVGSKFSATLHIHAYEQNPYVQVVATASLDPSLPDFCKEHDIPHYYNDYREMIDKSEIDLVDVCVPNFLHKEVAVAAAESGRHVITEKPIATTLEDADAMLEACAKSGVKLMYAEDWVFAPALQRAKKICDEGAIGDILYIKAKETHSGSHSPFAQTIEFCGGGSMIHLGIHPIGCVRWFKEAEVVEVMGKVSGGGDRNLKHRSMEGEDWAAGILTFDDGTFALVEGNYVTVGGLDDTVEIYGTEGVMKIDLSQGSPISVYSSGGYSYAIEKTDTTVGWTKPAVDEELSLGYHDEISHFVDCVRLDKDPMRGVRGQDGRTALEIVMAIYESARTGKSVTLDGRS